MGTGTTVSIDLDAVVEVAADLARVYVPATSRPAEADALVGVDDRVRTLVASLGTAEWDLSARMAEAGRLLARRATSAVDDVRRADR